MNKLHKKILSVGFGCFTAAASYGAAPSGAIFLPPRDSKSQNESPHHDGLRKKIHECVLLLIK
ncbi:MAG: hypothetical protein LBD60_01525 [Puniceicoccales bacterium]|jgi:hypothetical protein|nr:hypothetical protein [Puniceicoccales bacterium]